MRKMWIVIKREYAQVVKKKSFLIGIFLTPAIMALMMVVPALLAMKKPAGTEKVAIIDLDGQQLGERFAEAIKKYKLDDSSPAYQVTGIYNASPDDSLQLFSLKRDLDSLIQSKDLRCYMIIGQSAESRDSIILVAKSFSFRTSNRFERVISDILSGLRLEKSNINLDVDSVLHLTRKVALIEQSPGGKERDFMTIYIGGLVFVMLIFMTAIGYGQVLMRSVIEEKNSRIMEVLVSSVSAFQLMAGKIVGLGMASLTQVAVWIVIGVGIYSFRSDLNIRGDIAGMVFNPVFILFFIIFMILGYIMYSTLFALIGSICNSDKEAQNYIFPITMALLLPVFLAMYVIQEPDSPVVITLSLIPFFTPTMMIMRLNILSGDAFSLSNPIVIEAILGVLITLLTTIAVIWVTAKVFRVGILMYGKRPTFPELVKWIRY